MTANKVPSCSGASFSGAAAGLGWVFRILLIIPVSCCLPGAAAKTVRARKLTPDSINAAQFSGTPPSAKHITALGIRLQVLLARARFSPGEIDGKFGENTHKALRAYSEVVQAPAGDTLPPEIWQRLTADTRPVLTTYKITRTDVAGPFLKHLPRKMEAMRHLHHLDYTGPRQKLAEKFHMSQALLAFLNPGEHFTQANATIVVTNIGAGENRKSGVAARIEIDKHRQTVKVFDSSDQLLAFYPATVGSKEKPSPSGTLRVTGVFHNPVYHYNPKYHFKGVHAKTRFTIKPGPNNPVGTVWINLSAEGYGIHGTPDPARVSKAASHGCVRLTNWDAEQLAKMVKKGTPVTFIDSSKS